MRGNAGNDADPHFDPRESFGAAERYPEPFGFADRTTCEVVPQYRGESFS
jgi:hypothetical protein